MMKSVLVLMVAVFCSGAANAVISTTLPPTSVDNPTVVVEIENASNVSFYCEIRDSNNNLTQTAWQLDRQGEETVFFIFNQITLVAENGFDNFIIARRIETVGLVFSNLTIRVFDASLDNAMLSCRTGVIVGTYILKIISKN